MRLVEGGGRLVELKGGKLKLKSFNVEKIVKFEVDAVGVGKGNPKVVEKLLSRLWALSGLSGREGQGGHQGGKEKSTVRAGGGSGTGVLRLSGQEGRVLSVRREGKERVGGCQGCEVRGRAVRARKGMGWGVG